jgi:hypothetical protein
MITRECRSSTPVTFREVGEFVDAKEPQFERSQGDRRPIGGDEATMLIMSQSHQNVIKPGDPAPFTAFEVPP